MTAASPAATARADALTASCGFARGLYPDNAWLTENPAFDHLAQGPLHNGDLVDGLDPVPGRTYVVIDHSTRAEVVAADISRPDLDALARALSPTHTDCEHCGQSGSAVGGLLPVPAGCAVVVACLCAPCTRYLAGAFPHAHWTYTTGDHR